MSLVRLLGKDGSQTGQVLAKQLNVSAATVRRRIRKLTNNGTLQLLAVVDPDKVGLPLAAVVKLDVPHNQLEAVSDQLAALPQVKWVSTTTGRFNIMALVRASSTDELSDFMQGELTGLEEVRGCETLVCLGVKKGRYIRL